jgi:hypothetical protein
MMENVPAFQFNQTFGRFVHFTTTQTFVLFAEFIAKKVVEMIGFD